MWKKLFLFIDNLINILESFIEKLLKFIAIIFGIGIFFFISYLTNHMLLQGILWLVNIALLNIFFDKYLKEEAINNKLVIIVILFIHFSVQYSLISLQNYILK